LKDVIPQYHNVQQNTKEKDMKFARLSLITLWVVMLSFGSVLLTAPTAMARQGNSGNLVGTAWELVSYGTTGLETEVVADSSIMLEFPAANEVTGESGCNSYSGAYTVDSEVIVFSDMISTLRACTDDAAMEQEAEYLDALQSATSYELGDETLTVWYASDEQRLNFTAINVESASDPLEGTAWHLSSYGSVFSPTATVDGSKVTLNFLADYRVEGSGGCNGYSADYQRSGNSITFSNVFPSENVCDNPDMAEQESDFFAALLNTRRYVETSDRLTIVYDGVHLLRFTPITNDLVKAIQSEAIEACVEIWIVKSGDTLSEIAGACNITVAAILSANPSIGINTSISIGQEISIPLSGVEPAGPMGDGVLYVEQTSVAPGTSVNLLGSGYAPDVGLNIGFGPMDSESEYDIIGSTQTMNDGSFRVTIMVPSYATADVDWVFVAIDGDGATVISNVFHIAGE
jgi:heat shock protein HslJ/LysM repeat protein